MGHPHLENPTPLRLNKVKQDLPSSYCNLPTSCFLGPKSPHSSQWQRHTLDRHSGEREGF